MLEERGVIMNNDQMPQVLRYLMSSSTSSKDISSDFDGITLVRTCVLLTVSNIMFMSAGTLIISKLYESDEGSFKKRL